MLSQISWDFNLSADTATLSDCTAFAYIGLGRQTMNVAWFEDSGDVTCPATNCEAVSCSHNEKLLCFISASNSGHDEQGPSASLTGKLDLSMRPL